MAKTGQEAPKTAPSLRGLQESPTTVYLSCLLVLHPPVSSVRARNGEKRGEVQGRTAQNKWKQEGEGGMRNEETMMWAGGEEAKENGGRHQEAGWEITPTSR